MLNTSVETCPDILSIPAVVDDGIINRTGGSPSRIEELRLERELAESWIHKGVSSLYAEGLHAQSNKDLSRCFIQKIFNEGELSRIGDFMSPDVVNHEVTDSFGDTAPLRPHNLEWMTDLVYFYRYAFPDLHIEIQDQIAEGDQVVTRLRLRGTHKNALMTIAASGRKIDVAGIRIDRMAAGKIVESWSYFDMMALLHQLGALPEINRQRVAAVSLPQPALVS